MFERFSLIACLAITTTVLRADDSQYVLRGDSLVQPNVPQGKVTEHVWKSKVFAGTLRRY